RILFFQIQRHLRVRDPAAERTHEANADQRGKDEQRDDAERDDGRGAEAQGFEARRRQEQREKRSGDDDDRATQRELQTPAISNAVDDIDELRTTVGAARFVSHRWALLPLCKTVVTRW